MSETCNCKYNSHMTNNKTIPTGKSVDKFLQGVDEDRYKDSYILIDMMKRISGENPTMWGPSIIGFGVKHYKYDSGREGDIPLLAFSPRKASLTVYFEDFDDYQENLTRLGKHKTSKSCLYINKLSNVDLDELRVMLEHLYATTKTR